jgi:4-hydroxy-tetrahydrodipicolinate synthase
LSHKEHKHVIDITVDEVGKRVPVIAGTGSNSTTEAIRLTKHAKEAGADAALLITPYYNKPTQRGLVEHYKAVASACDIPQILYNVPGRTGVNMSSETVVELSKIDNIVGIKEASGDLVKCSQIVRDTADDFCVLSGEDALNYPILCCGGVGAISVTANVLPDRVSALCAAWDSLDIPTALKIHLELLEINQSLFMETNPIPVKTALAMMGMVHEEFKLPLCPMGGANKKMLASVLKRYGCIS